MPQPKSQPTEQPKQVASNTEIHEDGDIDDGYFDDLYDDASKAPSVTSESPVVPTAPGNTVEDGSDQEPNFYDTDMEDVSAIQKIPTTSAVVKTQNNVKLPDRDRSRSYSPHLSPMEARGGQLSPDAPAVKEHGT